MMEINKAMSKRLIMTHFYTLKSTYNEKLEEIDQLGKKIELLEKDLKFYLDYYTTNENKPVLNKCENCEGLINRLDHANKMRGNLGNKFGDAK